MELKIDSVKTETLSNFIRKLVSVDKAIYLKLKDDVITSNVYLPERDAVKLQSINISEVFNISEKTDQLIKISFFNGNKIIEALKHFSGENIQAAITYSESEGPEGVEYYARSLKIYNEELSIVLLCADPSIGFMDLTNDKIKNIFDIDDSLFRFELEPFHIDKLNSLFNLEKESQTFKITCNGSGVKFESDTYSALISADISLDNSAEVLVYKKYLPLIDKESYNVAVCNNKVVLRSQDSNTILTIATCQTGD